MKNYLNSEEYRNSDNDDYIPKVRNTKKVRKMKKERY